MRLHFLICHNHLDKLGIYPGQSGVLCNLSKNDGQSQKELCEKIHVRPATVTVMLLRMEKRNLVKRVQDEKDKRKTRIYLDEAGNNVVEDIKKIHQYVEKSCLRNISEEEKDILRRLLLKVRDNLREDCKDNINED